MDFAIIIPALNEGKTIGDILTTALAAQAGDKRIKEIIVVDDGSTDNTALVADTLRVDVVKMPHNMGKGAAMVAGARCASSESILFLDADLLGLKTLHISRLIDPVDSGKARMSLGIFGGGRIRTDLAQAIAPEITGQRALRKSDFLSVKGLENTRFGVDITLTNHAQKNHWSVVKVPLQGVTQVMKEEKYGLLAGAKARFRMYWDILRSMKA